MKNRASNMAAALALLLILDLQHSTALAQGTAFTYQGQLTDGGGPANGLYDFRFRLASDPLADNYVGSAYLTNGIAVKNGLFTVAMDFGPGIFTGTNYWLEVDMRTNGGAAYTELSPLQPLTPEPYAIFAENVGGSGLAAGAYSNAITLNNASNQFSGTFIGNAAGLTNDNAATLGGLSASNFWQTSGNIGTSPTNGNFLGTVDVQPVEIRVGGLRGWRVEPDPRGDGAANLIGGYISNSVQQPGSGADFIGSGGYVGGENTILSNTIESFIGAGSTNQIGPNVNDGFIGAGYGNTIQSSESVIAGGQDSTIDNDAPYSTIGGGLYNQIYGDNRYYGTSVIAGGYDDTIYTNSWNSFIGGGGVNTIDYDSDHSAIVGGFENLATGSGIFIGGGGTDGTTQHGNQAFANAATIGGGLGNEIGFGAPYSFIGGGVSNVISFYAVNSTIAGGDGNLVDLYANDAFIGGGYDNIATNSYATIGGGYSNYATGYASTVAGGYGNTAAGDYSFAGGNGAIAYGNRSFVWNSFPSSNYVTGSNEFFVFADNGFSVDYDNQLSSGNGDRWVYIGRGSAGTVFDRISATISTWTGAYLSDGGAWTSSSDRARKKNFAAVDGRSVLDKVAELPVQTWNYTNEPTGQRHMGPVAQDFHAEFGLNGDDDTHIADVDEAGVALAAIQGLNQKVEELKTELNRRDAENAELQRRLEALEQAVLNQKDKPKTSQP